MYVSSNHLTSSGLYLFIVCTGLLTLECASIDGSISTQVNQSVKADELEAEKHSYLVFNVTLAHSEQQRRQRQHQQLICLSHLTIPCG
jgi:hypothetical protein